MKKIYLLILLVAAVMNLNAQVAAAVVFTESGERFTLYLNGEVQNQLPQSNVRLNNLTGQYYQARVDFEDVNLPDFTNNQFAVQAGTEATYMIKLNKKGAYVLRFQSQSPLNASSTTSAPSGEAKRIADVDDSATGENEVVEKIDNPGTVESTSNTRVSTATVPATPSGENVSMVMDVNGVKMDVKVSGMENATVVEERTVSSSGTVKSSDTVRETRQKPVSAESRGGCRASMSDASFKSAKSSISEKAFDDTRLTVAKQVTKANCLLAAQVKDIMSAFAFEDTRLEYAKYAYDYCFNKGDYYQVNEAFTFESSIEDLNQYLESK